MRKGWMLLHRRHASLSRAKSALARWPSLSEARNARAASVMGAVETPVFWTGKRSGTGLPSSVIPLNGSATSVSPVCTYFTSCGGSSVCRARADTGVRCRTLRPRGGLAAIRGLLCLQSRAGAEGGAHGRQHLARDASHEAALRVVGRRRVRDRVQAYVVEARRGRPEHPE